MDYKKLIDETIEVMQKNDATCQVLYNAIESCSDESFIYHRDIVADSFYNNDNMIEEKGGIFYHSFTEHEFEGDVEVSRFDEILDSLEADSEEGESVDELKEFIEICYREYLAKYFRICLIRMNKLNDTLFE